jgi:hypothetical protein
MKFLKRLDVKNNKVLMGLLTLLFLGSAVQTAAILKTQNDIQNKNLSAQLSQTQDCLNIAHEFNTSEPLTSIAPNEYVFKVYMNVKNNCSYPVSVITPYDLHLGETIDALKFGRFEVLGQNNSPSYIANPTSPEYGINILTEYLQCLLCESSVTNVYASPAGRDGTFRAFSIGAGQTRLMAYWVISTLPDNPGYLLRVRPMNISWFRQSANSDGVITSPEIRSQNLGRSLSGELATDFIRVQNIPGSGMTELDEKNPVKPEVKDVNTKVQ